MKKLLLIDGNSLINRAYFAVKENLKSKDGIPTNAVHGFFMMLSKLINEFNPKYLIVAFDEKGGTFRHDIYSDYKSGRRIADDNMVCQFPIIKELLDVMNIKYISKNRYEADDILGTLSKKFDGYSYIATGDGDLLQLVDNKTYIVMSNKQNKFDVYDEELLFEKRQLKPYQIIEYKGLAGDSSDKIPGAKGIGDKKATNLLHKYDNIDNIYAHINELDAKIKKTFEEEKDIIYMSKTLATIIRDIYIDIDFNEAKFDIKNYEKLSKLLKHYGLLKVREAFIPKKILDNLTNNIDNINKEKINNTIFDDFLNLGIECNFYKLENKELDEEEFLNFINNEKNTLSIYIEENSLHVSNNSVYDYILNIKNLKNNELIFSELKKVLNNENITIYTFDYKTFLYEINKYIDYSPKYLNYNDYSIAKYLIDSLYRITSIVNEFGRISTSCLILKTDELLKEIDEFNLRNLYNEEINLAHVLYNMEITGFKVDKDLLKKFDKKFENQLEMLSKQIIEIAGEEFNINSPKQLSHILYDKLGLIPGIKKKTQNGNSTDAEVLNSMLGQNDIIKYLLSYREIKKLESSYAKPILSMLDKNDRIHTIFKQTSVATGRLSSIDPNLQVIPVKTIEGREFRKIFVASKNSKLITADYSQIELRILAHLSKDENLIKAFKDKKDIHTATAAKIFNINEEYVSPELRRNAKAINFGIIYGISAFGLSNDTGLSRKECQYFIDSYFKNYPKIREFLDETVKFASKNGYALSILNRRRKINELLSSNKTVRNLGERAAYNSPMQSSASDIIKLALNKVYKEFEKNKLKSKIILQIHDELVIDALNEEIEIVKSILKDSMENIIKLEVPLVVDINIGDNLYETKY